MRPVFACFAALVAAIALPANPPAARGLLLDAALNGHAVYAVGEHGAIIRSGDSGETWELIPTPTDATLTAIHFASSNIGWAVGHDGVILNTIDGGLSWGEQFRATDRETVFLDVASADVSRGIAIGAFGTTYITEDGGYHWNERRLLDEDSHLNRATSNLHERGSILIAGERSVLLRLPSFSKPAEPIESPYEISLYGVLPLEKNVLLAYGLRGYIFRSEDNGETWQQIASPLPALWATAVRLRFGTIVLAGQARAFAISRDGGKTFEAWTPPVKGAIAELIETPNGHLLAFGENGVQRLPSPESLAGDPIRTEDAP